MNTKTSTGAAALMTAAQGVFLDRDCLAKQVPWGATRDNIVA